jgi:hypothetical protein
MSSDAFSIVTQILKQRIEAALPNPAVGQVQVHVGPLDDQEARNARLVLFLYRVSINGDLRSVGHRIVPPNPNDAIILYENAIPFDLHYLISASPSAAGDDMNGLRDLGTAIQAVNGAPNLTGGMLMSDVVRLSFEVMSMEEMGRVWALFPAVNYRTSVVLLATPVWVDPTDVLPPSAPVIDETYRAGPRFPEAANGP